MNYKIIKINGEKIYEHRYVMQSYLGRKLLPNEIVHHKDRNRRNNTINNLELTTQSEHIKDHHRKGELHRAGYKTGCIYRYKYGRKVIVKNDRGEELFYSFSIKCAAKETGIPLNTLFRILNGKANQRNNYIVQFF